MSTAVVDAPVQTRRPRAAKAAASTSIRVSVPTRDILASAAAAAGLSLSAYLEKEALRSQREHILAEYRACAVEAYQDPAFVAEMQEWDDMDDGVDFDDDGWPEFNE